MTLDFLKNRDCRQARERLESAGAEAERPEVSRHLARCSGCAEYAALQRWSAQVLRAGEVPAAPPLMSAVWASIHRASEQAWDSALTRSFRNLLPYMVAIVLLIALVGSLTSNRTTPPVQAATTAYAVFNQTETPAVTTVMTTANMPSQDPADFLGVAHR
ncbi:MAG TPA: hypothetical protein VN690_08440 [Terriglobales bacterium]|nr:hypothetical protein [Terriglobales bacterium]